MIHLTHTGHHAGRPLCNCHKAAHQAMGDTFVASLHAPPEVLQSDELCLACKAIIESRADDPLAGETTIEWLDAEEIAPALVTPIE